MIAAKAPDGGECPDCEDYLDRCPTCGRSTPTTAQARVLVRKARLTEAEHQDLSRYVQKQEEQLGEVAARLVLATALAVQLGIDDDAADSMAERYAFGPGLDALASDPGCTAETHETSSTTCDHCGICLRCFGTRVLRFDGDALVAVAPDTPVQAKLVHDVADAPPNALLMMVEGGTLVVENGEAFACFCTWVEAEPTEESSP